MYRHIVEKFNMRMDVKKKSNVDYYINCEGYGTPLNINIDGLQQEEINEFCYLNSVISQGGRCVKEVNVE